MKAAAASNSACCACWVRSPLIAMASGAKRTRSSINGPISSGLWAPKWMSDRCATRIIHAPAAARAAHRAQPEAQRRHQQQLFAIQRDANPPSSPAPPHGPVEGGHALVLGEAPAHPAPALPQPGDAPRRGGPHGSRTTAARPVAASSPRPHRRECGDRRHAAAATGAASAPCARKAARISGSQPARPTPRCISRKRTRRDGPPTIDWYRKTRPFTSHGASVSTVAPARLRAATGGRRACRAARRAGSSCRRAGRRARCRCRRAVRRRRASCRRRRGEDHRRLRGEGGGDLRIERQVRPCRHDQVETGLMQGVDKLFQTAGIEAHGTGGRIDQQRGTQGPRRSGVS